MIIQIDESKASETTMAVARALTAMDGVSEKKTEKRYKVTYTATFKWTDTFVVMATSAEEAERKADAIMSDASYCTPDSEQIDGTYLTEEVG